MVAAVVGVVLAVLAVVLGGVAVAGLTGRLPRNRWAGVRTPAALRSTETFALANRVAAPALLAGSAALLLGALAPAAFGGPAGLLAALAAVLVGLLAVAAGGVAGTRAAAAVPVADPCGTATACASCTGCALAGAHP